MLYQHHSRFDMAEKGGVHRMSTRSTGQSNSKTPHETKWRKSQDHFDCFTNLIGIELEDELNQVQERRALFVDAAANWRALFNEERRGLFAVPVATSRPSGENFGPS